MLYCFGQWSNPLSSSWFGSSPLPRCIPNRRVCLSDMLAAPCHQYECVARTTACDKTHLDPACDKDGNPHTNLCQLYQMGKTLAYMGQCQVGAGRSEEHTSELQSR